MMTHQIGLMAVILGSGLTMTLPAAYAADPAPSGIVGSDAMGDKSRSGPDGWSWAPQSRNQAPAGQAPGQTRATTAAAPNAQPEAPGGKTLGTGEDPGTPAAAKPAGPGTIDQSAPAHSP